MSAVALLTILSAMSFATAPKPARCEEGCPDKPCASDPNAPILRISPIAPVACFSGQAGQETVVVRLTIDEDGTVVRAQTVNSSDACFNDAAEKKRFGFGIVRLRNKSGPLMRS